VNTITPSDDLQNVREVMVVEAIGAATVAP
jgi:hypothetical protein